MYPTNNIISTRPPCVTFSSSHHSRRDVCRDSWVERFGVLCHPRKSTSRNRTVGGSVLRRWSSSGRQKECGRGVTVSGSTGTWDQVAVDETTWTRVGVRGVRVHTIAVTPYTPTTRRRVVVPTGGGGNVWGDSGSKEGIVSNDVTGAGKKSRVLRSTSGDSRSSRRSRKKWTLRCRLINGSGKLKWGYSTLRKKKRKIDYDESKFGNNEEQIE